MSDIWQISLDSSAQYFFEHNLFHQNNFGTNEHNIGHFKLVEMTLFISRLNVKCYVMLCTFDLQTLNCVVDSNIVSNI